MLLAFVASDTLAAVELSELDAAVCTLSYVSLHILPLLLLAIHAANLTLQSPFELIISIIKLMLLNVSNTTDVLFC